MKNKFSIFIVEDDEWYGDILDYQFSLDFDMKTERFLNGRDCLKALKVKTPSLITIDYNLPDFLGNELFKKIKEIAPNIPIVFITAEDNIDLACKMIKDGAKEFIIKNNETTDKVRHLLNKLKTENTNEDITALSNQIIASHPMLMHGMIGESSTFLNSINMMKKAAKVNINVAIIGETGTGKELVAKAIHQMSNRKAKPFIAVNMAAIPKELVESELFGYEKGAFTGANDRRIGKFEEADGGVLFLDEIAEMEFSLQAKILRVIQEMEVTRLGANKPTKINTRIITATHKNLALEVKAGNFRQDLYYRLLGFPIPLAPLRERGKDIMLLAEYFLSNFCNENNLSDVTLSTGAIDKIKSYNFPGNIRELKAIVELAVALSSNNIITAQEINNDQYSIATDNNISCELSLEQNELTLKDYTEQLIFNYLKKYNNDLDAVSKKLDIGKSTIYRLLKSKKETEILKRAA